MVDIKFCPVCGSEEIAHEYTSRTTTAVDSNTWRVSRCRQCTHGFMNPQPTWEELQPYYPSDYPPYDPSHSLFRLDEEEVALARERGEYRHVQIREGQRILDVGSGGGYFLRLAARLGAVVEGVEPNPIGADRARASGLTVFTGTVEDYARVNQGRTFDLITANHVLEHTPTPVSTLKAMKQLRGTTGDHLDRGS